MGRFMPSRLTQLAAIARKLHRRPSLDEVLQLVVDGAADLAGAERASIRLLDAGRSRLLAICRAGQPLHENPDMEFKLGEGLIGWIAKEHKPILSGAASSDPRFVQRPGLRTNVASFVGVPLLAAEHCLGVLSVVHPERDHFGEDDLETLVLLAAFSAPHVEIARLARLSRVDGLTGALNRRGLSDTFPEVDVSGESFVPLTVAMVDIDHFKQVNDQHGHAVGDEVLKEVVTRLGEAIRASDAVIRYGGEEFLLLLPGVGLTAGARVAERARRAMEGHPVQVGDIDVTVTISLGVASRIEDESREALIARADAAMYAAKRGGRNRVALSG